MDLHREGVCVVIKPTVMPIAGQDYTGDLAQMRAWFPDDEACLDYLDWLRWPNGFQCPACESYSATRQAGRYRCRSCRKRVSVTAGTLFDKTRTPLTVWFEAVWLMTAGKQGVSAAHLHRVLPISSYQTAWTMLSKLRSAMSPAGSLLLAGRVEVDETFIGGPRPGTVGRGAAGKTLVAGAIEVKDHGWGRARLAAIPDASASSLKQFIRANIEAGSTVVSDGWSAYPGALEGYEHERLNVSASGMPAHHSLPAVHRLFASVKRLIDGTYQGSGTAEHLPEYLDEFVFRFNRRHSSSRGLVFLRLLQRAILAQPVSYQELVRVPKPKPASPTGVSGPRAHPGSLNIGPLDRPWRANGSKIDK